MKKNRLTLLILLSSFFFFLTGCKTKEKTEPTSKADLVDMFMGVQGFSNCVIGPQLPHGSVNPAPQTPNGHHDGYAPDQPIRGFGQLHVSGIGWGRYGQVFLSPQIGFEPSETGHDSPKSEELASPYYYKVKLDRYNILAEVTPTNHCALYRFTYPESGDATILLDIAHNIPQHIVPEVKGKFIEGEISYNKDENTITGWGEYAGGFGSALPYKVYFCLQPNLQLADVSVTSNGDEALYAKIQLPEKEKTLLLNVGISFKSVDNAKNFLTQEVGKKSFDEIKDTAKQEWEKVFSSIDVKGGTLDEQRLFYTTMYHSFVMPRDRTNDNPNWDSDLPHYDDHFCVWDTWRTKFPLMIIINESFVARNIQSFIDRYENDTLVTPTYTSSLEWDWKQGGDDVDNVIADAFVKKVQGFNQEKAYELIKSHAFTVRDEAYRKYGWVPEPAERMSCSYTMEYAYNDFCAAQVAKAMGDQKNVDLFTERSGKWTNLFNPDAESHGFKGFVEPRKANGEWISIDLTKKYGPWIEYFYEGNSWVYSLFAPHQFDKLIEMCGGKDIMIDRLTYGFDNNIIDMENEPGFLTPFIFTHCGRPDLTAKYVNKIRDNHFTLKTGYPENEDSGAMGSWYIFTSIGFFPNAGQNFYYLLPPAFPEITITRENGKKIEIKVEKATPEAKDIESVSVNGKVLDRPYLLHDEIVDGANIVYKLK